MFVDKDLLRNSFELNMWHRWPKKPPLWFYGILFSFGCSALCICILVRGWL